MPAGLKRNKLKVPHQKEELGLIEAAAKSWEMQAMRKVSSSYTKELTLVMPWTETVLTSYIS